MSKRPNKVTFRVSDSELAKLKNRVYKSRLSQEAYLRQLIAGIIPQDAPSADYFAMMRELKAVGNNLNQIAHVAHMTGAIDHEYYVEAVRQLDEIIGEVESAVLLPRRVRH
jgi:hypothetical protein